MKTNMGKLDRVLRVIAAVVMTILYFTHTITGTLGLTLLTLSAIFVLTSIVGFCPLYSPFGITTCPAKKQPL